MAVGLLDFDDKPNQRAFFYDTSMYPSFWGGFNNGKSYAGSAKGHILSECIPENVGLVCRKTYPALEKSTMETFLKFARARNGGNLESGPIIAKWNASDKKLTYKNGSVVWFVTLDSIEKLRGPNIGWVLIDQTEETEKEFWMELNGRVRLWQPENIKAWKEKYSEQLQKQLGFVPTPYNQMICVGNPSAKQWVRDVFLKNENKTQKVYQASTLENKKFIPVDYIERLKKIYPAEWIKKFLEGSWDIVEGQVYTDWDYENLHSVQPFDIPPHWPRFMALDHGVVNATCVLWFALDEEGRIFVYKEYYESGKGVDQTAPIIKGMCAGDQTPMTADHKVKIYGDYAMKGDYDSAGINMWEHYLKHGIFVLDANKGVLDGIQTVMSYLRPRSDQTFPAQHKRAGQSGAPRLYIVDGYAPWLVREAPAYQWEPTKEGQNAPEKPRKFFDHAMDTLRYGCQAIKDNSASPLPRKETPLEEQVRKDEAIAKLAFSDDVIVNDLASFFGASDDR